MSTLVLLSGGLDSTVAATRAVTTHGPDHVEALSIHYGQRHTRELIAATTIATHLGITHDTLDLPALGGHLTSALTPTSGGGPIPHGHYTAPTMAATVVPNRNAILLMCAVGIAAARGHSSVTTAVHAGDHPVYPDCRPEFITHAAATAQAATDGAVTIHAPFVAATKTDIAALGYQLGAPLELSWSCYEGGDSHCGHCGTCVERVEAFRDAGVTDPTTYTHTEEPTS